MTSSKKHLILNASPEDYENISKLFFSIKTQYFGRHYKRAASEEVFFEDYVTYRLLIPLTAEKYIIIGYAEVSNAPNLPALAHDLWLDFINFHYCCPLPFTATNTCFLNKFVYHVDYMPDMLEQLLEEIFLRENQWEYILVLECPDYRRYEGKDLRNYSCLQGFSTVFYPKCFTALKCPKTQKLHVIERERVLPQISYRKALPEDNDDIVDIVNQDIPALKDQLGEYYIAEELLSDSNSLLIVSEIKQATAGFIWLNDNIDLLYLLENYQLQCFGNLLKFNVNERFKEKVLAVSSTSRRALDKLFTTAAVNQIYIGKANENITLKSVSNSSSSTHHMETHNGGGIVENQQKFTHDFIRIRWEELNKKFKSTNYYVDAHKQQLSFFYNIPDGQDDAAWDTRLNAFAIELLGLIALHDSRRIYEFLLAAFAAFPNNDYCLLMVAGGEKVSPVLWKILKYFLPVNFRPNCCAKEYLFITHRCAVYGDLSLFAATPHDVADIVNMLKEHEGQMYPTARRANKSRISSIAQRLSVRSSVLLETGTYEQMNTDSCHIQLVQDILQNMFAEAMSDYQCFTIRCGDAQRSMQDNKIVGFVIIRPFLLSKFLQKHFHTIRQEELENFFKAEIITLKLHPFFHCRADLIFHELSRQTSYLHFYYLQPTQKQGHKKINDLVDNMQPLEPRRIKRLWFKQWDQSHTHATPTKDNDGDLLNDLDLLNDHFAVFQANLRPTIYFGSAKNIVILGFTDICKAFLRLMIFSWHNLSNEVQSTMNCVPQLNITVICSPGIMEADQEYAFECEMCSSKSKDICWINFQNTDAFIRDICYRLNVRTWINFVSGEVESIEGEKNLITMKSDCEVYYDTLLLMCGTEFGEPHGIFKDLPTPVNYCHFNNRFDKILFYHKLQLLNNSLPLNAKKSLVVYGCHVRAFEFVNFLLEHGIKACEIHLVMPYSAYDTQRGLMLNIAAEDLRIEEILMEMLQDLGVQIYEQMNLSGYKLRHGECSLQGVTFKKYIGSDEITLECDLFISFYEVFLEESMLYLFKAANIDTDHNFVLVDESYQTSAKNIYAMGNFIKHKTEPNHQYHFVDAQEAAEKIINTLGIHDTDLRIDKKFLKPSYFQGQLPMGYLMVKVTIPKRYLANHLNNEYALPLVTYNEGEFSRVRLNEWGVVEEIAIITKKKKNYDFLKFFCGRHELLLNNLKSRWYLKDIVSFADFFQEAWTELLMHDEFENLRIINRNLIAKTAQEILKKDMNRDDRRKLLYGHCQDLGITAEIEYAFIDFIRNNRADFATEIALPEDLMSSGLKEYEF